MQIKQVLCDLTPREIQVMWLISRGFPNKICAMKLGCSIRTIEAHRASIFKKLHVKNAVELVAMLARYR
ncbi:LuxR C-terminal-related transcriptional regulator [Pelistega suis]|uniref:Helix-turn-helix transcriptional regulator n=1 Tax=Pelistega suis TaxID=1631957 RepID=A0A849P6V3_9BURK|nr:helix-turn-helix transcriptional regulator [Pelistega suis]MCQ9329268.1 helix-turn-helix transcriptional regulator [Pelistega suis]NOL52321.1 helix-turn-helix transcriptional regulator [Pelistega suis]